MTSRKHAKTLGKGVPRRIQSFPPSFLDAKRSVANADQDGITQGTTWRLWRR
jgi:hypothetical protein